VPSPRARIIIIFVISWHSARQAHQSENRINRLSHSRPNSKYRGIARASSQPVKYHLIPREIRFNFAWRTISPGVCRRPRGESKSFDIIFCRKMFRSSPRAERKPATESDIKLCRDCGTRIDTVGSSRESSPSIPRRHDAISLVSLERRAAFSSFFPLRFNDRSFDRSFRPRNIYSYESRTCYFGISRTCHRVIYQGPTVTEDRSYRRVDLNTLSQAEGEKFR